MTQVVLSGSKECLMSRTSASRARLRSVVVTASAAVVLASLGVPGPAQAAPPVVDETAPAPVTPPGDPADEVPTEPPPVPPAPDGDVAVSAVVVTEDGAEVITEEVPLAEVAEVKAELREEPGVVSVSVDSPAYATTTPNDPHVHDQWGYYELDLDRVPAGVPDASGLLVAVIDTGVLPTHEDLAGRVRCDLGADFTDDEAIYHPAGDGCVDPHGHGTHVAGTVAAISNNGLGVAGTSAAQIIPIRVLSADGSGWSSDIAQGIIHAVDAGAKVINMSIGGGANGAYDAAVQYALAHDVVVVAAAGNYRLDGNWTSFPGATPGVLSVAASDWRGVTSSYSNTGPTNFITAPGTSVLSTSATDPSSYEVMSGTSMASPHVAGVLARYRALYPAKTVAQIRAAVQATAIDIERPGRDNSSGYGLLDAYELLTGQQSPTRSAITAPGEPTGLRVTAGNRALGVAWGAPEFTGGSAVAGYLVEAFGPGAPSASWLPAGARSHTIPNLVNGAAYDVYVTAWNAEWYGNPAIGAPVTPLAPAVPGAPALGVMTAGNASVQVRWGAAAANRSTVVSYTVKAYRGTTLVKTVTVPGTATTTLVSGLLNGSGHTFTVTARNGVGYGPSSVRSAAVVPRTKPGAPRIASVSAGRSAATVKWSAPNNGGSSLTSYVVKVFRGSALVKTVTVRPTVVVLTVTGLAPRTSHRFTVTATNALGAGPASAASAWVVPLR
jgi:subtilisin family serine protease